jgi:hypothetical protein
MRNSFLPLHGSSLKQHRRTATAAADNRLRPKTDFARGEIHRKTCPPRSLPRFADEVGAGDRRSSKFSGTDRVGFPEPPTSSKPFQAESVVIDDEDRPWDDSQRPR